MGGSRRGVRNNVTLDRPTRIENRWAGYRLPGPDSMLKWIRSGRDRQLSRDSGDAMIGDSTPSPRWYDAKGWLWETRACDSPLLTWHRHPDIDAEPVYDVHGHVGRVPAHDVPVRRRVQLPSVRA